MKWMALLVALLVLPGCSSPETPPPPPAPVSSSAAVESTASVPEEAPVVLLSQFLLAELSSDFYSNFEGIDNKTMNIWCVNEDEVKAVVERYSGPTVSVSYFPAHYPQSLLMPFFEELADSPFLLENISHLRALSITGKGIEITVGDINAFPALLPWLEAYEHRQYVYVTDTHTPSRHIGPFEPVESEPDTPITLEESPVPPGTSNSSASFVEPYIPPGAEVDNTPWSPLPYMLFSDYLDENLSPDDYSNFDAYDTRFDIWCVNEEKVRRVVDAYDDKDKFDINYKSALYSRTVLLELLKELQQLPELAGFDGSGPLGIREDGVHFLTGDQDTFNRLTAWRETYPKREFVWIDLMPAPTNPS